MKVYVVWYNNGEAWEDNFQCIDHIFATRELAEKYLDDRYVRTERMIYGDDEGVVTYWEHEKFECRKGQISTFDCDECPLYESKKDEPCEDYYKVIDNGYDLADYSIREFECFETMEEFEKVNGHGHSRYNR